MEARTSGTGLSPMDVFVVKASSIVEMKENNINAPYKNRQVRFTFEKKKKERQLLSFTWLLSLMSDRFLETRRTSLLVQLCITRLCVGEGVAAVQHDEAVDARA